MHVMDLTGRTQPLAVQIETASGYEFVTSLCAFFEEDKHGTLAVGGAWAEAIRASAPAELLDGLACYCCGSGKPWMVLWSLVYESQAPKDAAALLACLEDLDPIELRLRMLGEHCPAGPAPFPREVAIRAANGDAAAQEEYLARVAACDENHWLEAQRYHITRDPDTDKRDLIRLLHGWYSHVFRHQEADLAAILARDGAAKAALARTQPPDRLIELATNGLRYNRQPGIDRVILIPTVLYRPWVLIWDYRDAVIFCYGVAEESLAADEPPDMARLIAVYKALADERRLSALRRLADRSYTLQELADSIGIGKSLMHHHMVTLRAAGLVRVSIGGERRYELRTETLAALPGRLEAYLGARPRAQAD